MRMNKQLCFFVIMASLLAPIYGSNAELVSKPGVIYQFSDGGIVKFSISFSASKIYYDNNFLVINNFNYGFGDWGQIGFSCETVNATMTVNYVNPSSSLTKVSYTTNAGEGVESITKIFVGNKGEPKTLDGANDWSYDSTNKIITVTILHSSSQKIIIIWDKAYSNVANYMDNVSILYVLLIMGFISALLLMVSRKTPQIDIMLDSVIIIAILAVGGVIMIIVLNGLANL